MSLLVTFLILAAGFSVALFAFSLVLQNYLYSEPASLLPVRALAGGLLASAFLIYWVHVNTRAETKDRYGTLFEFNSTSTSPFEAFTATRRYATKNPDGTVRETKVKFARAGTVFIEGNDPLKPFKLTTSDYLVTAIEVPQGETVTRFEAELFVPKEGNPQELRPAMPEDANPTYDRGQIRTFREANGSRYIEFSTLGTPGPIQSPSRGAWLGAILLNVLHFAIWLIVFWPILRFTSGTALGLAAGITLAVMFFLMPILFDRNKSLPAPPATTQWSRPCWMTNAA